MLAVVITVRAYRGGVKQMNVTRIGAYLVAAATSCFAPGAAAATWYGMDLVTDSSIYFFDADSVKKQSGIIEIWVKTVRISSPDRDGAWATATRWRIKCLDRTIQALASSDYDNSGKFIRAYNNPESPSPAYPDSIGEGMLQIACESSFPDNSTDDKYWKLATDDVFEARDWYVRALSSRIDTAPK